VSSASLVSSLSYLEVILCLVGLCLMTIKKQWADYWALCSFLAIRAGSEAVLIGLWRAAAHDTIGVRVAYSYYFYIYWSSYAIESILGLVVLYSLFRLAMAPLTGLKNLGMMVFRWVGTISVVVALSTAFSPHVTGKSYLMAAISQLQRSGSMLTLCLLLFVCFAIRPMGLSYSSRIFGVSLGLGLMATTDLVQTAWMSQHRQMYTGYSLVNGIAICVTLSIWATYFALPEPKRRMIVLPTTSPFLRWNQISLALGDNPGFVAVGGVPPELFAPAELEVMRRASLKMPTPFADRVSAAG
jgi:hypothetical protein